MNNWDSTLFSQPPVQHYQDQLFMAKKQNKMLSSKKDSEKNTKLQMVCNPYTVEKKAVPANQ